MSWIDGTRARLRLLFSRQGAESRIGEELRFHIEMETERLVREAGLDPPEARRRALVTFGGVEKHKEALRDGRGVACLTGMSLDVKLGLRMLWKHPLLTSVSVISLAVGIPMGLTPFHIADALEAPLPVEEGDRVLGLGYWGRTTTFYDFTALREELNAFQELGALRDNDKTSFGMIHATSIAQVMRQAGSVPVHLVVDSTGLKIFGEGEWLAQKHKTRGIRRRWRKLHLGLDLASGAIVCADLTHDDVGDSTALPGLLDQMDAPVTGFLADGAYDGASTRDLLRERYGETLDVVIPPPKNAVIRPQSARDPTVRDRHIAQIRSNGRMAWQVATGYNQRSRIETQIGRWKSVIGPKLRSRSFSRQITEIQVGQKVLNTMTALGRPVFERIA